MFATVILLLTVFVLHDFSFSHPCKCRLCIKFSFLLYFLLENNLTLDSEILSTLENISRFRSDSLKILMSNDFLIRT